MSNETVESSIWIAAERERVWQAVTDPAEIAQWFLPPALGAQMKRNDSGSLFVCMGEMEIPFASFEDLDPPLQVSIRNLPDQSVTATYTLAEENGGTRVTITMGGFESLPKDVREERVGPSRAGWEKALENLKSYIDGAELPFPQGYIAALLGYRRETKQTFAVERSIWIKATRERVWRAITDPEQLQQWFSPGAQWHLSAMSVGGQLSIYDAESDTHRHIERIELIDPPHQFRTRSVPDAPETPQVTTWTLTEEKGGTRLTVTNAGYELVAEDLRHPTIEQNAFGYGMMLENLQAYIDGGSLPYPFGFWAATWLYCSEPGRRRRSARIHPLWRKEPIDVKDTPIFAALADPVRRSLLLNLAEHSPRTATQLAEDYPITRQGILKHLHILDDAGLVVVYPRGREKRYTLSPEPLSELDEFVKEIGAKWDARLQRLKAFLEAETDE